MSTALPSTRKTHSEQHKQILKQLLKEDANKTCADCKSLKNPRWASWNLGCFLCIRCSGIHRSMGTHISKVKSVDLDAWTDEQINSMVNWGNKKCNLYWEDKLPQGYTPDQSKLDNFIRTKYDMKKWVKSATIPNPSKLKQDTPQQTRSSDLLSSPKKNQTKPAPRSNNSISHDLLSSPVKQTKLVPKPNNSVNLLDDDEAFGAFTSSPSPSPSPQIVAPTRQTPQSAQSTGGSFGRPDLKKSILSLYSSPSNSNQYLPKNSQQYQSYQQVQQPPMQQPPVQQAPPAQPVQSSAYDFNSLSSSLNGLNFNSTNTTTNNTSTKAASNYTTPPSYNTPAFNSSSNASTKQSWNNEWSENNSSTPSINTWNNLDGTKIKSSTANLDDDLFKNVWS